MRVRGAIGLLRYPGGKQWFINFAQQIVVGSRPRLFIEPFAGGATVGLTLLARDCFDQLVMVEKDHRVASFWRRVLTDPSFPAEVEDFNCTRANVERLLTDTSEANLPMWVLIRNRCSFGGNISEGAGLMRKIACRWNGPKLADTMRQIQSMAGRITLIEGDGIEALRRYSGRDNVAFVDPPCTVRDRDAGHRLYREADLDHTELLRTLQHWPGRLGGDL